MLTVDANNVKIYKNGQLENFTSGVSISSAQRAYHHIGSNEMNGYIEYVRVWDNIVLNAEQINKLHYHKTDDYNRWMDPPVKPSHSFDFRKSEVAVPSHAFEFRNQYVPTPAHAFEFRQEKDYVPIPSHEFEFRNKVGAATVVDTYDSSIVATPYNGLTFSTAGAVFDGVDDYLDLTPWEFGGKTTIEMYVKYDSFVSYGTLLMFIDEYEPAQVDLSLIHI